MRSGASSTDPSANPILIRFEIDASIVPAGEDQDSIVIARNGAPVTGTCAPAGQASPSPCIDARSTSPDGDISITVLTLSASTWNLAVAAPVAFGGFQPPVDELPTLNHVTAGRSIPVKFSLGGDRGLAIFQTGSPLSRPADCALGTGLDAVEQTLTAGSSALEYDAPTDTYTYVWKTERAWAGTCRLLTLSFADGSTAEALFDFRR